MGLYVRKNIAEVHGGRIWAKNNEDGKGDTFSFGLPVKTTKDLITSVLLISKTLPSTHNSTVILFLGLKMDSTKVNAYGYRY